MRTVSKPLALLVASLLSVAPAWAQSKKDAKAPAAPANETRYFTALSGLLNDRADAILKEVRQGGRVTAATLDVCFPVAQGGGRFDRFVSELAIDGAKLSGTAQSIEDRLPVSIELTRKANGRDVDFTGKIALGAATSEIVSTENSDISESEFRDAQIFDEKIVPAPADFSEVSPESVAIKVRREALAGLVGELRGRNVQISLPSLIASCADIRAGAQTVRVVVDPDRAADLIAAAKGFPGVMAAGWADGAFELDRSLRLPAADWRAGGKLDREKLAARLSDSLAKLLGARPLDAKWDETTGELSMRFKRPSAALPALNLTETITVDAMAAADRPGGSEWLLVWVGAPASATADETGGSKLSLASASEVAEDGGGDDEAGVIDALARDLKAQRWDADRAAWK